MYTDLNGEWWAVYDARFGESVQRAAQYVPTGGFKERSVETAAHQLPLPV
jgi:hypothetical protein